jgi:ABC-type multidrug transport system fused ATPase/permease subunit
MDYDVVLVMDEGRAVEFGSPKVLLQDDNGIFTTLVAATGPESASALRNIADSSS